jgi:hypothetical protein
MSQQPQSAAPAASPSLKPRSRSGSETRHQSLKISFRVTPAEQAEIETSAASAGLTVGSYIRARILTAARTQSRRRPTIDQEAAARFLKQLHRAGANVYQVTRRVNFGEGVAQDEITATISECRAAIAACHAVLGTQR